MLEQPTRTEKLPSDYDCMLIKGPLEEIEEMWEDHSSARYTTKGTRAPPDAKGGGLAHGEIYS